MSAVFPPCLQADPAFDVAVGFTERFWTALNLMLLKVVLIFRVIITATVVLLHFDRNHPLLYRTHVFLYRM